VRDLSGGARPAAAPLRRIAIILRVPSGFGETLVARKIMTRITKFVAQVPS